jgi:hypothetical protein
MTISFTPGPWKFTPWHIEEGEPTVRAPKGWIIGSFSSDANAELCSLAPDLYATLKRLCDDEPRDWDAARELLAKIEGKTP